MMVILNPNAGGGTASEKWARIKDSLPSPEERIVTRTVGDCSALPQLIEGAINNGEPHIVAAGGDGTVHEVLNALMSLPGERRRNIILGAIGLGSSNDFHKPVSDGHSLCGIPLRIDFRKAQNRDVGVVEVETDSGVNRRCFLINASIGLTAEGNTFFNTPDSLLHWLKKHSTGLAIFYAAVRSIMTYQNEPVKATFGGRDAFRLNVTNLGIVKNPHFSGSLHYDQKPDYTNGMLGIFAANDLGFWGRLKLLRNLSRGRFSGLRNTFSRSEAELTIETDHNVAIEVDGEIIVGRRAHFSVLQNSLMVCT